MGKVGLPARLALSGVIAACVVGGGARAATAQISIFGSSADLNLKIEPLERGAKSAVTIDVLAKKAISPRRVYVEMRCTETVEIDDYAVPSEPGKKDEPAKKIKVRKHETVESKEFEIAGIQQLLANSTHQFKGEIEIPKSFPITTKGKMFRVTCEVRSGLDITGNDPNSPWQNVAID